jgi:hypothetical protein
LFDAFAFVAHLELSTMTVSPDDQHHHDAIIQVEPEQYRGLDARSYTARRLVPPKALDFSKIDFC